MPQFYEFFAGGGMARAGLGSNWTCLYANDFDPMKVETYKANWGKNDIHLGDINSVTPDELPDEADLAWASFPCQDLSLAGNYAGIGLASDLTRTRSGTFWAFWRLMQALAEAGRAPSMIVLENVYGVLTANEGRDFAAIGECLSAAGYRFGAMLVDAVHFVPQSRPRVFILAVHSDWTIPQTLLTAEPSAMWSPRALIAAQAAMSSRARSAWVWWNLKVPTGKRPSLNSVVGKSPEGVMWHSADETARLIAMMSDVDLAKLERLKRAKGRNVATVYRRTRQGVQRAELRVDGVAGCLRTPSGGSSRQLVVIVEDGSVRSRLLSAREAAKLMGLTQKYKLPRSYNDAYHVAGDGVVVPVVRHLTKSLINPLAAAISLQGTYADAAE